ncbi:hypothetical protein UFOVP1608_19 [uncultured Caudovirales phage]|uniref:Uncharacterized protein n=1 Tax=uncultured Caudovirales phage TaxID=2100421 RepID=A0A6J5SSM8_9CAUD|nr:hypothetical protein UFOVP1608_19 [uncultured Caudovirales phage]
MTTTVLRPDGVASGSGNFAILGGAATLQAAVNDDLDATYVRKSATGTASIAYTFGTTSISSSQIVRQVRLRARVYGPTSSSKCNIAQGIRTTSGLNWYEAASTVRGSVALSNITGAWYSSAPDGTAWSQANIDALRVQITDYKDAPDRTQVYELFLDVDIATEPTTTVASPTGTITDTAKPDISWSFSDVDGDAQTYYEAKIFTAAQYGIAGFDPSTSPNTWESGQVTSAETSAPVGDYLANATFRAYVRTGKTINGAAFLSDWAYSGFTVSLTPPTTPTLTTSYSSATNKVTAVINGASSALFDYQLFQLQRAYTDSDAYYEDVRDCDQIVPGSSYDTTVYDYESDRGVTVYYRARAIGYLGDNVVATAWSTTSSVSVTNDLTWWFKAIGYTSLNTGGIRVLEGLPIQVEEDLGVFRPKGRTKAMVVSGSIYGEDGSYRIVASTDAQWTALKALILYQGTLLVQDPFGDQKYIRITSRPWTGSGAVGAQRREVAISYVEVDA